MGRRAWFPFTAVEIEIALGVFGFLATALSLGSLENWLVASISLSFLALAYLAGLMVYARRATSTFEFLRDGAVSGHGYKEQFRAASKSVFLMHVDDDPPSEELLAIYRDLLERGVQIRRIVFLRPDAKVQSYEWVVEFGDHRNLQQRAVLPEHSVVTRFSFAIVDERTVLMALPGYMAVEAAPYTDELVFRHLMGISDEEVASVFLQIHHQIWERARPLKESAELLALQK